jgi:hypothetical protein
MRSPAAKSRAPGSCRRRRRGQRHRRHASHVMRAGCSIPSGPPIGVGVSSDRPRPGGRTASGRRDARWCSRRVPERMAERVAGIGGPDAEDEQALISLEWNRDAGKTVKPASWRVSSSTNTIGSFLGFGHLIRGDGKHLMAPTVRFLVRVSRPCHCWVRHGDRPLVHRVAARRSLGARPVRTPAADRARLFQRRCAMTGRR